jgi:hypothetical protein
VNEDEEAQKQPQMRDGIERWREVEIEKLQTSIDLLFFCFTRLP